MPPKRKMIKTRKARPCTFMSRTCHGSRRGGSCRGGSRRGGSLFSWIKNKAIPWARRTKAVSRTAGLLGELGVPHAARIGQVAGKVGFGNFTRNLRRGHTYVRSNKLLSRGARAVAMSKILGKHSGTAHQVGNVLGKMGYGLNGRGLNMSRGYGHSKKRSHRSH
jgi:hypothetical protein